MRIPDLFSYSLSHLADRKLRTALTLAGIVIGVACLASLQSFAEGARANVLDRWRNMGAVSQFMVTPRGEGQWFSRHKSGKDKGISDKKKTGPDNDGSAKADEQPRVLDAKALDEIRALSGVRLVSVARLVTVTLKSKDREEGSLAYGLPADFPTGEGLYTLVAGAHLTPSDADGVLIGKRLAGELGFVEPEKAVGEKIEASWEEVLTMASGPAPGFSFLKREKDLIVRGIIDGTTAYMTVGPFNSVLLSKTAEEIHPASLEALRAMAGGDNVFHSATVFLQPGVDLEKAEKSVKEMGFDTHSALDLLPEIRKSLLYFQVLLGCLGGVALSVAALGIANTFLTSVYERTHEIGVRRAVGARRGDIRSQFLFEAASLGLAGSFVGLAIAWLGNRYLATTVFEWMAEGQKPPDKFFVFSPRLVAGCIGFAVILSVLASLYPATRAARLNPVDSLRHE